MLENFSAYLLSQNEKFDSIFEELREFKFKKRPVYSASIIQFVLLRYTSRRSYRILQKDFLLLSIPLLKKICSGAIDAVNCDQTLKNERKIFGNVCLLFNEIPTNTPRGFHVETTWKRSFPRRFNVESTLCVCRDYLQKCEEHFGGDLIGCGEDGNVYKGLICFIIDWLK